MNNPFLLPLMRLLCFRRREKVAESRWIRTRRLLSFNQTLHSPSNPFPPSPYLFEQLHDISFISRQIFLPMCLHSTHIRASQPLPLHASFQAAAPVAFPSRLHAGYGSSNFWKKNSCFVSRVGWTDGLSGSHNAQRRQ